MRHILNGRWSLLLLVGLAMTPGTAFAQLEQAPPYPMLPLPLHSNRIEEGGPFVSAEFLFWLQSNPMERQTVATRGFVDTSGGITGTPGTFVGTGQDALHTDNVSGPLSRQPGVALFAGWRFRDGILLEIGWWHLTDARYSSTASLIPANFNLGPQASDTFLFSPVFNFPINYAGPDVEVSGAPPGSTFGIWNAATTMTIDFVQRFDMGMINFRVPIDKSEFWRMYGIVGFRTIIMWERFKWRTVAFDDQGLSAPDDQAIYSNVVSNRWYGANFGVSCDWFLGDSPLGAFSVSAEVHGSIGIDIVKERAKYELGDFSTAASRAINEYTVSPVVQGDLSIWWYPTQSIQVRMGWQAMAVFNTVASPNPIDFNMGAVAPEWERGITRWMRGMHIGVGFIW